MMKHLLSKTKNDGPSDALSRDAKSREPKLVAVLGGAKESTWVGGCQESMKAQLDALTDRHW
jgi:hypothetical protein